MAREQVQVIGFSRADPAAVWAVAGDFCARWHPAVETMREERDDRGRVVRAFTIAGEDRTYCERLTFLSDSDMTMAYTHVEGIAGVDRYDARLTVAPAESGGSVIRMTATLSAPVARAAPIAAGTRAIFEEGAVALAARAEAGWQAGAPALVEAGPTGTCMEDGAASRAEAAAGAGAGRPAAAAADPAPIETRLIDDLPRLALDVTPAREGPLCLFLHGIGGARGNWRGQLGVVGRQMRAAALDLRGYGGSTLGQQQSTVDDYCADILRVAEVLGARRLVLVGLSYGSWLATSFAMRHPQMLAGLVLSGGCTGMSEAGASERDAFRVSREVPLNAGQVPADFAPAVVKAIAGPNADEAVRRALLESMAAIPAATYRDALTCFTNPPERFDFARLTMPVLLMTGEHDRLAPPEEIRGVAERILDAAPAPDVRFEVLAGAGHVCNVEAPEQYNRHLSRLVARVAT